MLDALGMAKPCIPLVIPAYLSRKKSVQCCQQWQLVTWRDKGVWHVLEVRGVSTVPINSKNWPTSDVPFCRLYVTSCVLEGVSIPPSILCLFGIHKTPAHQECSQVTAHYTLQCTVRKAVLVCMSRYLQHNHSHTSQERLPEKACKETGATWLSLPREPVWVPKAEYLQEHWLIGSV